jgi:hypothetical protein
MKLKSILHRTFQLQIPQGKLAYEVRTDEEAIRDKKNQYETVYFYKLKGKELANYEADYAETVKNCDKNHKKDHQIEDQIAGKEVPRWQITCRTCFLTRQFAGHPPKSDKKR